MQSASKMLFGAMGVAAVGIIAICSLLFIYSGDLPDIDHLSGFAPNATRVAFDSCLASSPTAIPNQRLGSVLKNAIESAEPQRSESLQISRSLLCNSWSGGAIKFQLDTVRLNWRIRRHFSRNEILTIFANRAYFGGGIVGVENASKRFFNKDADQLSL